MQYTYNHEERKGGLWLLYGLNILTLVLAGCSILGGFGLDALGFFLGCQDILEELLSIVGSLVPLVTVLLLRKTIREQRSSVIDVTARPAGQIPQGFAPVLGTGTEGIQLVAVPYADPRAWCVDAPWEPAQ